MKAVLLSLLLLLQFQTFNVNAEEYTDWQGYPPFVTVVDLAEFKGDIFGATLGGLFRYDPETKEYTLYYKNRGLPNNNVTAIAATSDALYLGFQEDGLWRFDPETETFTQILFPEYHIKTAENISGISVNDIVVLNDDILYVGHSAGVDRLDLANNGIKAYTTLGTEFPENTKVTRIRIIDGIIYACTNYGVASADESDPNLEFADHWISHTYFETYAITDVFSYAGRILASTSGKNIFQITPGDPDLGVLDTLNGKERIKISAKFSDGKTYVAANWRAYADYFGGLFQLAGTGIYLVDDTYTDIRTMMTASDGKLWMGTETNGLQCFTDDGYLDIPKPSELSNNPFYNIALAKHNIIWTASSDRDRSLMSTFQRFDGETWTNYPFDFFNQTYRVTANLVDCRNTVWLGTWGRGVYVIDDDGTPTIENDAIVRVDTDEVIIKATIERHTVVVSDFREDKHGNVWIANFMEEPGNHKIEPIASSGAVVVDGYPITKFKQYSPAEDNLSTALIYQICPDDDGWVWLGTHTEGVIGIFVGEDPFNKDDFDSSKHVKNLKLEDGINAVRIDAINFDHDGDIWVGSNGGLNRIVKDGFELTVTSENDLLSTASTTVRAIEIDPYNNKWIGTENGLVKISADNEFSELHLTSNSGIFSNLIFSLSYDESNDVLWIGTATGLNRFDVFAGEIKAADLDVRVYPNPFEIWGSDSRATFPGLKAGSSIKIYSFNGELLNEATAESANGNGGADANWDGRNFEGNYVGSGVYFFTGIGADDRNFRDKMVVLRR